MADIQLNNTFEEINEGIATALDLAPQIGILKKLGETNERLTFNGEPIKTGSNFTDIEVTRLRNLLGFSDADIEKLRNLLDSDLPDFSFEIFGGSYALKLDSEYTGYDCTVDWGDGTQTHITDETIETNSSHIYPSESTYIIAITGNIPFITFSKVFYLDYQPYVEPDLKLRRVLRPFPPMNLISAERLFEGCTNLTEVHARLFVNNYEITNFENTFKNSGLITIPSTLFRDTPSTAHFYSTFAGCTNLTGLAPELWLQDKWNYTYCFRACTGLENYADIPSYWK